MIRELFGPLKIFFPQFEMSFVGTTAALIAGGLAAAGTVGASVIGADAQGAAGRTAENTQRDALAQQERLAREGMAYQERQANSSLDFQRQQYNDAQAQLRPYGDIQLQATKDLQGFTDPNNPIYQQQRQQMTQQLQQQLAAQGLLRSRDQVDNLGNIELGLNQQRLGVQQGLAGLGASQGLAGLSQQYGQNVAGIQNNLGSQVGSQFGAMGQNALASGQSLAQLNSQRILAGAQGTQGLISGLGNIGQNVIGSFAANDPNTFQNRLLASLMGGQGAGGTYPTSAQIGAYRIPFGGN